MPPTDKFRKTLTTPRKVTIIVNNVSRIIRDGLILNSSTTFSDIFPHPAISFPS
jgi:hypothetical protein